MAKSKTKPAQKKNGRPSIRTAAIVDEILLRISEGEPLRAICRDESMPHWNTVYNWLESDPELSVRFARARERGEDAIAQECLDIADTPLEGVETEVSDDGKTKEKRGDMLGHRKLQIETRLKLLAKWNPKKYGDLLKLSDPEGKAIAQPVINLSLTAGQQT